ncbi:tRNA glutamyl-Q(34) synthetase GluQRS [Maritimibacter sp. 55A14]|uniref:tRNA glutamyl-Q(34) synthetase GluQRS n=1 Tax=Maritimibacter sp. 55A14 TaxID=2174844 RepID=UPI000D622700|nr:tRNA glutamyl-Q(34) synthetase GluQRS [Maritimibacter sp. 55A14]PWE34313.1 tRNA glutamyl-Q(34) synthetase GluQRS [Maritimibacter sp. 55A14]
MCTRFAPSPTGLLHLGHAFSALTAWDMAQAAGGTFLLRIEDIDTARARPEFEAAIFEDLAWLGLDWPRPVMRQSDRMPAYRGALTRLAALGVVYPCSCSRADIRAALAAPQERAEPARDGPDGPVYPGTCRGRGMATRTPGDALRLDMVRALARLGDGTDTHHAAETGAAEIARHRLDPDALTDRCGDIVLARRDIATSYHLSVVVDDAAQGITHVVRGRDLLAATPIHILLQALLELPHPSYHHHVLIRDEAGRRLAKRDDARALRLWRESGESPADLRRHLGLPPLAA